MNDGQKTVDDMLLKGQQTPEFVAAAQAQKQASEEASLEQAKMLKKE